MSHPITDVRSHYAEVQSQVFCDDKCTEWSPNGAQLMAMSNVARGMLLHNLIVRAAAINAFDKEGTEDWAAFIAQLNVDHPIVVPGDVPPFVGRHDEETE